MKKEELLSISTAVFQYFLSSCNYKETSRRYHQAHKEIREIIETASKEEDSASKARDAYGGYREDE